MTILYPSCSEAAYKINTRDIKNKEQRKIFRKIIKILQEDMDSPPDIVFTKKGKWKYNPYFEKDLIDLFLDYFEIPSERTHWTNGTTYKKETEYNDLMKAFCKKFNLRYRNMYERRYKDE